MTNTINIRYTCVCLFFTSALTAVSVAQAQTCSITPGCAELGYTKSASDCTGKNALYCPFDKTKAFCVDEISCESLGFTDIISECPGSYVKCPKDATKGKCDFQASPGSLKYSLRTSDHFGWLLCDGRSYSSVQYPELYAAIRDSFGNKLPNYSGYFLKGAATTSASAFKTAEQAGLPDIYGKLYGGSSARDGFLGDVVTDEGAFSISGNKTKEGLPQGGGKWGPSTLIFRASKSNAIYGRSTTVTPPNYSANIFIYAGRKKPVTPADQCIAAGYLLTSTSCPANASKTTCPNDSAYFRCDCNTNYIPIGNTCERIYNNCAEADYIEVSELDSHGSCNDSITIYLPSGAPRTCYPESCKCTVSYGTCYSACMDYYNNNPNDDLNCQGDCNYDPCSWS